MIIGDKIVLRALEPDDIDLLYQWENDRAGWHLSNTLTPFSRFALEQYVMNADQDIFAAKQLRLMIDKTRENEKKCIGAIDLFDFDPTNKRAGIGILIEKKERGKAYASEALKLLIQYCFSTLELHQIYCNIEKTNDRSLKLFQNHGFEIIGLKKDWIRKNGQWADEYILQLLSKKT
ncbi:MAG: GNAT family N-acetyltransferase [Bacteroidetes bacterium]|nr:MAG: GNAT family N-acetyltransferase [Bacteroidota bacterium]